MAQLHINNISVLNNPAGVLSPFCFDITFQCFAELPGNVEWKLIYIGSPSNSQYDQVVDEFTMDGLKIGTMNFQMESNCPNFSLIPQDQIIGTTAVLISVSYEKQEFFRVGYYVRSEYDEGQEQPQNLDLTQLKRYILADSPRIFRFEIEWVAKDTQANYDQNIFNENIGMSGGDPFQSTNGALQALDQMNYSNCMFTNN